MTHRMPTSWRAAAPAVADTVRGEAPSANVVAAAGSDLHLVARIRAGEISVFDDLVRAYARPLRAYVKGFVASSATAEELVQDVFLNIWRMRETWQVRTSVRAYLFQAAHNVALAHCRRVRTSERWEHSVIARGEVPVMGTTLESADQRLESSELSGILRQAIDRLPPRCRQVAILRFVHELTYSETAHVMGVTVKAVERHAVRALREVRAAVGPYLRG